MTQRPEIRGFFDEQTNTITYLVWDRTSREAAVIDPVLDYDPADGTVDTRSAQRVLDAAEAEGLSVACVLETHAHADHLSAAPFFKAKTGAKIGIGARIREVQKVFRPMFCADDLKADGGDFDLLLSDGDRVPLGGLEIEVIETPGHTAADVSYRVGDAIFVGDTLFMPDYGTARTDFPGGDARRLYRSIRRLLDFPPETRLFLCHDYKLRAARTIAGKRGSARSAGTCIWLMASRKMRSSACARRVMRPCRRQSCCSPPSR